MDEETKLQWYIVIGVVLMIIGAGGFMYDVGYENGRSNPFPLKESGCHDIDEICHEEVLNYAKLCIEEKEVIAGYYNYSDIVNEPIINKELWDICDGVKIR